MFHSMCIKLMWRKKYVIKDQGWSINAPKEAGNISLLINIVKKVDSPETVNTTCTTLMLTKTIIFISIILISPLSLLFQAFLISSMMKFAISSSRFRIYFSSILKLCILSASLLSVLSVLHCLLAFYLIHSKSHKSHNPIQDI